jgi:hypothetical protein
VFLKWVNKFPGTSQAFGKKRNRLDTVSIWLILGSPGNMCLWIRVTSYWPVRHWRSQRGRKSGDGSNKRRCTLQERGNNVHVLQVPRQYPLVLLVKIGFIEDRAMGIGVFYAMSSRNGPIFTESLWNFYTIIGIIALRSVYVNNVRSILRQTFGIKKNAVYWDVTPCGSCKNRRFGRTYLTHNQDEKIR